MEKMALINPNNQKNYKYKDLIAISQNFRQ